MAVSQEVPPRHDPTIAKEILGLAYAKYGDRERTIEHDGRASPWDQMRL
jgi:hypothetical protein